MSPSPIYTTNILYRDILEDILHKNTDQIFRLMPSKFEQEFNMMVENYTHNNNIDVVGSDLFISIFLHIAHYNVSTDRILDKFSKYYYDKFINYIKNLDFNIETDIDFKDEFYFSNDDYISDWRWIKKWESWIIIGNECSFSIQTISVNYLKNNIENWKFSKPDIKEFNIKFMEYSKSFSESILIDSSNKRLWENITNNKQAIIENNWSLNNSQLSIALSQQIWKYYLESIKDDYIWDKIINSINRYLYIWNDSYFIDNLTLISIYKILFYLSNESKQFNFIYNLKNEIQEFVSEEKIKELVVESNSKRRQLEQELEENKHKKRIRRKVYINTEDPIIKVKDINFYDLSNIWLLELFIDFLIHKWKVDPIKWKNRIFTEYDSWRERSILNNYITCTNQNKLISTHWSSTYNLTWSFTNIDSIVNLFLFEKKQFPENNYINKELSKRVK